MHTYANNIDRRANIVAVISVVTTPQHYLWAQTKRFKRCNQRKI